jgi:isoquinoline 1-oxidoreductase subunit beta
MDITRRRFVALAGAGLTLGWVPGGASASAPVASSLAQPTAQPFAQPFVRLSPDGVITVIIKHLEMGQGINTGLCTLVAEEMDADMSQVRAEAAPFNPALYKHVFFGFQSTGGSTSTANSWQQMREAGAVARAMLLSAAAQRWQVPVAELTTHRSEVFHGASGRKAGYGELAQEAAALPVPTGVPLKSSQSFELIGRKAHRLGQREIAQGQVRYGIDQRRPGMKVAVLQRPPRFGATVRGVDATAARATPGVRAVHNLGRAVAVVADHTWAAMQGRRALKIDWDETQAETRSTEELKAELRRLSEVGEPGIDAEMRGQGAAALAQAAQVISADFELPYLAHQPMEPMMSMGEWKDEVCEVWAASQNVSADQAALEHTLGLPTERVKLHVIPAGGSFGRRATFSADWVTELALVLKAQREAGERSPVQLVWSREDDVRGGFYRPMNLHRLRAGLDAQGCVMAVDEVIVCQSFMGKYVHGETPTRPDPFAVEGHFGERYDVPHSHTRWINAKAGVPVHTYRALGYNHTTFCKEVLMDELARAAGQDPLAYRLMHLKDKPRQAAVLRAAAEMAGYGRSLPAGQVLGVGVQEAYGTVVAQIAEVSLKEDGAIRVERVWCAVECGTVVNPDVVKAQMESGIAFGLTAALHNAITLDAGHVQQSNFHDAPVLRMPEMPQVDVRILPSQAPPTGVGEPGSVPILGAVANAFAQLTGKPVRSLPLRLVA